MNNFSKIVIIIVVCIIGWQLYDKFLSDRIQFVKTSIEEPKIKDLNKDTPIEENRETKPDSNTEEEPQEQEKEIYVYMLTVDKSGNQFLKPVSRPLPFGKERLSYSIDRLFEGPNGSEISKGIYTEIPNNSKLVGIKENNDTIIIDITENFCNGGGSDSIYSRMRQLIKTVLANTNKKVYLNINGKRADIIGGEGISITQPLSENSLDE